MEPRGRLCKSEAYALATDLFNAILAREHHKLHAALLGLRI